MLSRKTWKPCEILIRLSDTPKSAFQATVVYCALTCRAPKFADHCESLEFNPSIFSRFHSTSFPSNMFGFGSKTTPSAPPSSSEPTRIPPPPAETVEAPRRRTFESLVEEELPIQRHSVAMEGGMPSCLTLFDNFLLCYCAFSSRFLLLISKPHSTLSPS
jgi:hypothetical protein